MNLSYWEMKSWLTNVDFTIVGSGIVGLNCALSLKSRFPKANILILERGILPQGASTKNAGFACFGSLSEVLEDLKTHSEQDVLDLVKKRVEGLNLLRQILGDSAIDYHQLGGYELFTKSNASLFEACTSKQKAINTLLFPIFKAQIFHLKDNTFHFKNINNRVIFNPFEGQLDTGRMMAALLRKAQTEGIKILNNVSVEAFSEDRNAVKVKTHLFTFSTSKLLIATNGFASTLNIKEVHPARAQVLITTPIKDLHIKGTFHMDRGYYYFRNIDDRILFGGGRHLDFKTEETMEFEETERIQNTLEDLLKTVIIPGVPFEIEHRWSGIMGIGQQKKAIVKALGDHVYCGVRLGGMGVAIGSLVGQDLAGLLD